MAYLLTIYPDKCQTCGKPAKFILRTNRNLEIGRFCKRHGDAALKEEKDYEQAEARS